MARITQAGRTRRCAAARGSAFKTRRQQRRRGQAGRGMARKNSTSAVNAARNGEGVPITYARAAPPAVCGVTAVSE